MKRSAFACLALLICASFAAAQQPLGEPPVATLQPPLPPPTEHYATPIVSLPEVTPEMWLYSQEWRRHDDPAQAVRRKAEARAAARTQRLEAMRWYGMSNARPQAAVTPFMGVYSPAWSGNGYNRYDWIGAAYPATTLRVENSYFYDARR